MVIDARQLDIAWAAGFFDGEGSVSLRRTWTKATNRKTYSLYLSVHQVDLAVLQHFATILGRGKIAATPRSYGANRAPTYQWCSAGAASELILTELLPYLVLKRERALLGLEYRKHNHRGRSSCCRLTDAEMALREAMAQQMRALNLNHVQRLAAETKRAGATEPTPARCDSPVCTDDKRAEVGGNVPPLRRVV
jgi:hypothetical protein